MDAVQSTGDDAVDIVVIDHYPGTWCCGSNYRDWGRFLDTLRQIATDFGKEMAVMETGFSTFDDNGHGQRDQENFVNAALDEILARVNAINLQYPANAFLLASWYELVDTCTGCPALIRQEPNFGILTSTAPWGVKLAYDDLRYQVSRWN